MFGIISTKMSSSIVPNFDTFKGSIDWVRVAPPKIEGATLSAKYPPLT